MSMIGDLLGGTPDYAGTQERLERQRQQSITQGTENINRAFGQFNDQFYKNRAQAYVNYAMPQVAQQYQQAQKATLFGLTNKGQLGSSVANEAASNLSRTNAAATRNVWDTGMGQAQGLKSQIENARNTLLNQLYQSADPGQANMSATNVASNFAMPSAYVPIANMFSGLVNQYAQNQALAGATPYYMPPQSSSTSSGLAPLPTEYHQ